MTLILNIYQPSFPAYFSLSLFCAECKQQQQQQQQQQQTGSTMGGGTRLTYCTLFLLKISWFSVLECVYSESIKLFVDCLLCTLKLFVDCLVCTLHGFIATLHSLLAHNEVNRDMYEYSPVLLFPYSPNTLWSLANKAGHTITKNYTTSNDVRNISLELHVHSSVRSSSC